MEADRLVELDRFFAERANTPFGDLELVSGRTLQPFSIVGQQAATNLLTKAVQALDTDESERARRYVDRAVRLPYDRHEETEPVAMAVHLMLFCDVSDAVEGSDEDDAAWLEAAIGVLSVLAVDRDYRMALRQSR